MIGAGDYLSLLNIVTDCNRAVKSLSENSETILETVQMDSLKKRGYQLLPVSPRCVSRGF